jgi:hypothetical protein
MPNDTVPASVTCLSGCTPTRLSDLRLVDRLIEMKCRLFGLQTLLRGHTPPYARRPA